MHREETETLTLWDAIRYTETTSWDAMRYFNDEELNPRDELLQDFKLLLKVHRDYINGLSNAEYREFKIKRAKAMEQGGNA